MAEGPFTWRDGKLVPMSEDYRQQDLRKVQDAIHAAGVKSPEATPGLRRFERRWWNRKLAFWMDPCDSKQQWYLDHALDISLGLIGFVALIWLTNAMRGCG